MKRIPSLVVIDPYLTAPEIDATNTIQRILYKTTKAMHQQMVVQVITPGFAQTQTAAALHEIHPVGIISLGSRANVTDDHRWFETFEQLMKRWVFEEHIPFLGICFTHQYLAQMLGAKVDFLKQQRAIPYGRFDGSRTFDILHPKLRLYFADVAEAALGTECKDDLDFKEALRMARTLDAYGWQVICNEPRERLHPQEARLRQFLDEHCPKQARFGVAHEQEVYELPATLALGATSRECAHEAFVSETQDLMTFQAHPEYNHTLLDGKRLIRNFIYNLCI